MSVAVCDLPPLSGGHRLSKPGGKGFVSHVNSNLDVVVVLGYTAIGLYSHR